MSATYNYVQTTKGLSTDRLFILDNFGHGKRGAYYLMEQGDRKLEEAVSDFLLEKMAIKTYEKIIFVGTSKGGYAAMYYGLKMNVDEIIAGAPQYYLGDYLTDVPEKKPIFLNIVGNPPKFTKKELNDLLPQKIKGDTSRKTKFHIHYSSEEHTYEDHIKYLLNDLKLAQFEVYENIEKYKKHQEVALYFPQFLIQTLQKII
nr:accessory Sec system protein Asp2 [Listeria aquatica]